MILENAMPQHSGAATSAIYSGVWKIEGEAPAFEMQCHEWPQRNQRPLLHIPACFGSCDQYRRLIPTQRIYFATNVGAKAPHLRRPVSSAQLGHVANELCQ